MGKLIGFQSGDLDGVDKRLVEIVKAAAQSSPYDVKLTDGMRSGGLGNHKHGYAIDVQLIDPVTQRALPNRVYRKDGSVIPGAIEAIPAYEQYAKLARGYQAQNYPELGKTLRWGGGFRGGGTPFDLMHLDITPKAGGAMAYYNWDTGWNQAAVGRIPGLRDAPVPSLGLTNEVFPVAPNPRTLDQKRMQYQAALDGTPLPRPRPDMPPAIPPLPRLRPLPPASDAPASLGTTSPTAMSVTPRLPANYDVFGAYTPEQVRQISRGSPALPTMDQSNVQARATILDEGIGSLLSGYSPSAPNPTPRIPFVSEDHPKSNAVTYGLNGGFKSPASQAEINAAYAGIFEPQSAPPANSAALPKASGGIAAALLDLSDREAARQSAATLPRQSIIRTGQGIAGTAELPRDVRPNVDMPSLQPTYQPGMLGRGQPTPAPTYPTVQPYGPPPYATSAPPAPSAQTIANPDFAAWAKRYGDGSQVQTAPTGGLITANQLAAISGSGAPIPAAKPVIPPAPPKTITVPVPASSTPTITYQQAPNAPDLVQGTNGYWYRPNSDGTYTSMRTQDQNLARLKLGGDVAPAVMSQVSAPAAPTVPALPGMVPGAQPQPRASTLGSMLGGWFPTTPVGRLTNLLSGRPQAPYSGLLGILMGDVQSPFSGASSRAPGTPIPILPGDGGAAAAAKAAGQRGYITSDGGRGSVMMPTTTISGAARRTYGDPGGGSSGRDWATGANSGSPFW